MAIRDWFFWPKRPAHDPCHGKPNSNPTLRVAAATMAVSLPLIAIFDEPPPSCIPGKSLAQQFNAAWKRMREDNDTSEKIPRQDRRIDPGYGSGPK